MCEELARPRRSVAEEEASLLEGPAGREACRPHSPLPELLEDHAIGEALAADPNALENPVAAQLVQHQMGIQFARLEKTHACGLAAVSRNSRRRVGVPSDSTGPKPQESQQSMGFDAKLHDASPGEATRRRHQAAMQLQVQPTPWEPGVL